MCSTFFVVSVEHQTRRKGMSRYRRITEATMAKLIKEGRGEGRGKDYNPG